VSASAPPHPGGTSPDDLLGAALQAVSAMDTRALENVLTRASVAVSRPSLRRDVVEPLLVEIGERWRDGSLRIAHEHLATAVVRTFVASLNQGQEPAPGAPVLVAGTPTGQVHELGALLAASHAMDTGWHVYYLGPNLPVEEIAAVALEKGARAIMLSLVYPAGDPGMDDQLRSLRRMVGVGMPILVGGQACQSYLSTLVAIDAQILGDQDDLDRELASHH